ncbi:TonB-dependent receptor [Acinetobacter puyangensis]|uniref:Outer-membrane receptor for ferric coprogen and ferric-rhodotorulic acid n=1 Tax=Acinetobacter puyangensis TaxID=1096779 RepID=A0A240EC64_9GAMM|nr:TonB-dependent receptor [Acinetobacter puyangensis]SNX46282.1 outer-membrane receptor for ferric coprogen and ferric-rhodotorulic acid [Acinetobacter puyangensis]
MSNHLRSNSVSKNILLKPLVLSIHFALFTGTGLYSTQLLAAEQIAHYYQIPATTLAQALSQFALQSNVTISMNSDQLQNIKNQGLSGSYTLEQGFAEILKNTNFQIQKSGSGYVLVEKQKQHQPQARDMGQLKDIDVIASGNRGDIASDGDTVQLPMITVVAENITKTEGTNSYTTRATTTGKFEQPIREIPQSISVMTRKQLDDQNITNLKEAMLQATGVTVTSNGAFAQTGYQMRGYTALQQQDGMSVGAGDSYTISPTRDMEIYDRIEVLRGPTGLLEGSGDPSGVINMVRRRPSTQPEGFVNLSYGSWNNKRVSVGVGNALNSSGTLRGRMILTHQDKDFFYDHAEENRDTAYAIVEADLTDKTLLTVAANYSQMDSIPFYGWPPHGGGFSRKNYLGASWNKTKVPQQLESLIDLSHEFSNGWKIKSSTVYQKNELDTQMGLATTPNASTGLTSYYGYKEKSKNDFIGTELNLIGDFDLFNRTHQFVLGANWNQAVENTGGSSNYDNDDRSSWWDSDSFINPHISADDIPSPDLNRTKTETTKSGIYAVVKYKLLDPLTLIAGGRWSNYDAKSRGIGLLNASDWEKSTAQADMEFTPYGGLVWNLTEHFTWYASYTDIFSPQTAKDWQGIILNPRVGWQVETGIKGEFFDGQLNSALSIFRIRDKNRATNDMNPAHYPNNYCSGDGISSYGCSIASGLQQTQGIELELVGKLTDQWHVISSYVYTDAEVLETNSTSQWDYKVGENFAPRTPKHAFKLWTTYDFSNEKLTVGGGLNAQSSLDDSQGNLHNPGFAVFSLQAGYKINPDLNISLNVNNIFDTNYFVGMGYAANRWMYGEPRNFMLTLRAKY